MPSYRDRARAKYEAGIKPREKVVRPTKDPTNNTVEFKPKQTTTPTMLDGQEEPAKAYDSTDDLRALGEARKNQQVEGLRKRMEQQRMGIEERRAGIPEQAQEQRRRASAQSRIGAKRFGEFLASRGLARSGEAGQARLMQQMALQGQLGDIGRQEQSQLASLGREERGLEQQLASDIGIAQSGIDAQTMQALINARQQQATLGRQEELRQQQARTNYLSQMGIADPYGGQMLTPEQLQQVSPYSQDYAAALQGGQLDPQTRALVEQARFQKVTGDPNLMSQYGEQYMTLDERQQQEALRQREAQALMQAQQEQQMRQMEEAQRQEEMQYERGLDEREQARRDEELRLRGIKTAYETSKPYYKPEAEAESSPKKLTEIEYGEAFNEAYGAIKPLSWDDARNTLTREAGQLIGVLGQKGYEELWNAVFADAISKGRRDFIYRSIFSEEDKL